MTCTCQNAFIQNELDKILGLEDGDEVLTPFTANIHYEVLPHDFVKPDMPHYDRIEY